MATGGKQLSVLQRVTGWLTGKGAYGAQAAYGGNRPRGYYGSPEAEDAYGSMYGGRTFDAPEESAPQAGNPSADRFSGGADPYNGRVPYRSQHDAYQEQEDYRQSQQPDLRHRRQDAQPGYQQAPEQPQYRQAGNVVDFPVQQEAAPAHVEYVILLRSRNECTKVIEYIKSNASVFLNMEYIANEGERQRCVDMLSGAAYTLGCQLHKISNRGIYLIASPYVRVMIDPAMKRFNTAAEAPAYPQQTGEYPPVSEPEWNPQYAQEAAYAQYEAPAQAAAPYAQQQRQQSYSPFQRPRPTFQSQQQEPFRRASGQQYFGRQ
jgi:FtsZ-interacting cell division protein YlmF